MSSVADLGKLADTPAHCAEAEGYRAGMNAALEGWEREKQDRILNLKRLLPLLEWAQREEVRSTLRGLEKEFTEFYHGRKR